MQLFSMAEQHREGGRFFWWLSFKIFLLSAVSLYNSMYVHLSVSMSVCLSPRLSVCLSPWLSVSLSVSMSVLCHAGVIIFPECSSLSVNTLHICHVSSFSRVPWRPCPCHTHTHTHTYIVQVPCYPCADEFGVSKMSRRGPYIYTGTTSVCDSAMAVQLDLGVTLITRQRREAVCGYCSSRDRVLTLTNLCQELEAGDVSAHPKTKYILQGLYFTWREI